MYLYVFTCTCLGVYANAYIYTSRMIKGYFEFLVVDEINIFNVYNDVLQKMDKNTTFEP
jgi:hypothetical protein